jgi:hypothetical protein
VRTIDGVPCVQLVDLLKGSETMRVAGVEPSAPFRLGCVHCQCRVLYLDFRPDRRVLAPVCASCGAPAMNPIIPEGHAEGSEAPASGLIVQ